MALGMRQVAAGAAALALIALIAVTGLGYDQPTAATAQAKVKESKKPSAAQIKGLQGRVATVMKEERREGEIARKAMMDREQKELELETAEDGLQAMAEGDNSASLTLALKGSHQKTSDQSIQELKDQIAAATARADKAKAARKKMQSELLKQLNKLSQEQVVAHEAAVKAKGDAAKAVKAAAKGLKKGVAGKADARATMIKSVQGQESVLASMDAQLLALPKVRAALKQSLNAKELKIADEVAKSLGAQFNITGVDDAIVAEVAVAAAEKDADMPLQADAVSPALNFTAPPLADDLLTGFEQAQKEVDIEKDNQ
jgi:hypothetical protein